MTYTVDFDSSTPVTGRRRRPYTLLYLYDDQQQHRVPIAVLVDTGADVSQLPMVAATRLGMPLGGHKRLVRTAGGLITVWRRPVVVEVFGNCFHCPVDFAANPVPLLGRATMFIAGSITTIGLSANALYEEH